MIDFGMRDRVVLVTGAGSGIGREVAGRVAAGGGRVAVVDLNEADADRVVAEIKEAGGTAAAFSADVRSEADITAAVTRAEELLGPLDGVVACAGISRPGPAEDMTLEAWSQVVDTNLTGAFLTARVAGSRLLGRGGSMVLVSSVDGMGGHAGRVHYTASKFGLSGITKSLAIEWGRRGVRVNAVAPGPVDTPLLRAIHSDEALAAGILVRTPLGRLATPADQANAILFLLSDAAAFVTGVLLPVDGGLTAGCFNDEPLPA
jgi:NAD(P)-dependent dehydrogenase (short-subunit alcohol dehydrogenase family)